LLGSCKLFYSLLKNNYKKLLLTLKMNSSKFKFNLQ
jgi:hypothetical protein